MGRFLLHLQSVEQKNVHGGISEYDYSPDGQNSLAFAAAIGSLVHIDAADTVDPELQMGKHNDEPYASGSSIRDTTEGGEYVS